MICYSVQISRTTTLPYIPITERVAFILIFSHYWNVRRYNRFRTALQIKKLTSLLTKKSSQTAEGDQMF